MKYITILLSLIFSSGLVSQNFIDHHFDGYADMDETTVVHVYGKSFDIASEIFPQDSEEAQDIGQFIGSIEALDLIVVPDLAQAKSEYKRGVEIASKDFTELVRVKDKEGRLSAFILEEDDVVYEVIALGYSADNELMVFSLTGEMQLDMISHIVESVDISGNKSLSKLKSYESLDFEVYPNPVKSESELQITIPQQLINGKGTLVDLTGKQLKTFTLSTERLSVETSSLTPGSYLINLIKEDVSLQKRFIVVK